MVDIGADAAVRRLWDRFAFGQGGDTLAAAQANGLQRSVAELLSPPSTNDHGSERQGLDLPYLPRPRRVDGERPAREELQRWRRANRQQERTLLIWWLGRMVTAPDQARERLTWFWHGHFATSRQKVKSGQLMATQNQTFRRHSVGRFGALAQELIVDPAMLIWLDGNDNTVGAPNENLSREFMELFTLGHGHYGEADVREAARALTGWKVNPQTGRAVLKPGKRDDTAKQILGHTGPFTASSFVDVLLATAHSPRFVVSRLWFRLVSPQPPAAAVMDRLVQAYGAQGDIAATLRAITSEPGFRDSSASLVKQPVEWVVGLLRALEVAPSSLSEREQNVLIKNLTGMGQVPFLPPSVGGWPAGSGWLTTAAGAARIRAAGQVGAAANVGPTLRSVSRRNRPEQLRRILGVDRFSERTRQAILAVADRPVAACVVAACSPEYVVSR